MFDNDLFSVILLLKHCYAAFWLHILPSCKH